MFKNFNCLSKPFAAIALLFGLVFAIGAHAQRSGFEGENATWFLYGVSTPQNLQSRLGHLPYDIEISGPLVDRTVGRVGFQFEHQDIPNCSGRVSYCWEYSEPDENISYRQLSHPQIELFATIESSQECREHVNYSLSVHSGDANINCQDTAIARQIRAAFPDDRWLIFYRDPSFDRDAFEVRGQVFRGEASERSVSRFVLDDRNTYDRRYHVNHRLGLLNLRFSVFDQVFNACYYYVGSSARAPLQMPVDVFSNRTPLSRCDGPDDVVRADTTTPCAPGSTAPECVASAQANSCQYAYDGDCDEPNGLNYCAWGTDTADCSNPNSNFGQGSGYISR